MRGPRRPSLVVTSSAAHIPLCLTCIRTVARCPHCSLSPLAARRCSGPSLWLCAVASVLRSTEPALPDGLRSLRRGQGHRLWIWSAPRHPRAAHARAGQTGSSASAGSRSSTGRSSEQRGGGSHSGVAESTRGARIHDEAKSRATAHRRTAGTVHAHRHSGGSSRCAAEKRAAHTEKEWK